MEFCGSTGNGKAEFDRRIEEPLRRAKRMVALVFLTIESFFIKKKSQKIFQKK